MSETLTARQIELLAIAGANVAGGRHAFRISDESVKASANELVADVRRKRRNSARRESYKWRMVGERFAFDIGYSEEQQNAISEWQDRLKARPHSDAYMRDIARALFNPRKFATKHSDAENVEEYRLSVLANWREIVREYREWRESVAEIGMTIPVSLADMRADHGSRFFNYAVRKWNVAQYPVDMFGASVEDTFQTAMLECIAAGDWINPKGDGRVKGNKVPLYGALWRHVALAVRRAIWQNTRFTYDSPEPEFDWEEWERTANDSGQSQSIHEWMEYDEFRAIRDAMKATRERIAEERATRMAMIDAGNRAIAELLNEGISVATIARILGRTVQGLADDVANAPMLPAPRMLPSRPLTAREDEERLERIKAERAHAETLRLKRRALEAENYANGRVFRRGPGSTRRAVADMPREVLDGVKCSPVAQGSQRN